MILLFQSLQVVCSEDHYDYLTETTQQTWPPFHCRVMPPGVFNIMILEQLPYCCKAL